MDVRPKSVVTLAQWESRLLGVADDWLDDLLCAWVWGRQTHRFTCSHV